MTPSSLLPVTNFILALGCLLVLLYAVVVSVIKKSSYPSLHTAIPIVLLIASAGVIIGPLIYQYYFGFPACTMCWYQRIFMFPIAFMVLGAYHKNQIARSYTLSAIKWLAPAGLVFSIWHYISQWGLTSTAAACGTVGQSVSCDGIDVIVWNFLTIPLMAGLGFISLFLLIRAYTKK